MKTLPKATSEDLSWFKLERYPSAHSPPLGIEQWVVMLERRLHIKRLLNASQAETASKAKFREEAEACFQRIAEDPLCDGRASPWETYGGHHPTDTATVKYLRVGAIKGCADVARSHGLNDEDIYSLQGDGTTISIATSQALVLIDLSARDGRIVNDFQKWLESARAAQHQPQPKQRTASKRIEGWAENLYLPYYDLHLFGQLKGVRLLDRDFLKCLGMDTAGTGKENSDLLRPAERSITEFTPETVSALRSELT